MRDEVKAGTVTVFVTKYALTRGLLQLDCCTIWVDGNDGVEYATRTIGGEHHFHRLGVGAFLSAEEAMADAVKRKERAIAAAQKKVEKLKAMKIKLVYG